MNKVNIINMFAITRETKVTDIFKTKRYSDASEIKPPEPVMFDVDQVIAEATLEVQTYILWYMLYHVNHDQTAECDKLLNYMIKTHPEHVKTWKIDYAMIDTELAPSNLLEAAFGQVPNYYFICCTWKERSEYANEWTVLEMTCGPRVAKLIRLGCDPTIRSSWCDPLLMMIRMGYLRLVVQFSKQIIERYGSKDSKWYPSNSDLVFASHNESLYPPYLYDKPNNTFETLEEMIKAQAFIMEPKTVMYVLCDLNWTRPAVHNLLRGCHRSAHS